MFIKLDSDENFLSFEYAKITCGGEISGGTGYSRYCRGNSLETILSWRFEEVQEVLKPKDEETQFILYLEWDALRSALAQYLGLQDQSIDVDRCRISSIDVTDKGIDIAEVVLPPAQMPKIVSCGVKNKQ